MDCIKWGIALLVGAAGGFGLAKLFGEKEEDFLLLKMWGDKPGIGNTLFEIPMAHKGGEWAGGTPCSGEDVWTVERISKSEYLRRRQDLWRKWHLESEGFSPVEEEAEA